MPAADQLKQKAAAVQQDLRDIGHTARAAANEQVDRLKDQASEYYQRGRHQAEEWEHTLEHYVQDKPVQSLLIAAGVGLLLGALWKRS